MPRATFNGIQLGTHAWVQINTEVEVEVHQIPRADGAIIRRRGGGVKTLTVNGWTVTTDKKTVEQYFDTLASNLTTAVGDLIVDGETYSDCILKSISPSGEHNSWATFTITFLQSM